MNETIENDPRIQIRGVELSLSTPDQLDIHWIGQNDALEQLLASWLVIAPKDLPLNPRLIGAPGVGKTTLAYTAAQCCKKEVYIFQCTMDTRPEDLIISPVMDQGGNIRYAASPLVSSMIRGGVCILDEANRMGEKSWASLAPLLDQRRYVESVVAGLKIHAHPDFRIVVTMNDDASTFDIPDYIHSRLQPQITLELPDYEEQSRILKETLPFVDEQIFTHVVQFLEQARLSNDRFSIRDGINIALFCAKRIERLKLRGVNNLDGLFQESVRMILGDSAVIHCGKHS